MKTFGLKKEDKSEYSSSSITITNRDGTEDFLEYTYPECCNGRFGVVKIGGDYHLLDEDDEHFWTILIFTEIEFLEFIATLKFLKNNMKLHVAKKGHYFQKVKFINGIPKVKSENFNIHYNYVYFNSNIINS